MACALWNFLRKLILWVKLSHVVYSTQPNALDVFVIWLIVVSQDDQKPRGVINNKHWIFLYVGNYYSLKSLKLRDDLAAKWRPASAILVIFIRRNKLITKFRNPAITRGPFFFRI